MRGVEFGAPCGNKIRMRTPFFFLVFSSLLASCKEADKSGANGGGDRRGVFCDYKVWAEEGQDSVTVMLRFLAGDEEGPAQSLPKQASVTLDDRPLQRDSARFTGVYYEAVAPLPSFAGEHRIAVGEPGKKIRTEAFRFEPFSLRHEIPDRIKKQPFVFDLRGLPSSPTVLQLVMADTSFRTNDVNEAVTVENGQLTVTAAHLSALAAGPVTMEIYRVSERALTSTPAGGRIVVTYGLRRQFELVASAAGR